MKKKFFIIFFTFLFIFQNQSTAYSNNSEDFITSVIEEAKEILIAANSKKTKEKKLSEMAVKITDIDGIGMYSLGSYKKILTDDQFNEYKILFKEYFLKSFTSRLADYSDPKIQVLSSEKLNDRYTIVRSSLIATDQRPEVKIDWRVYTANADKPLVRDLIVEGLSLARTQKEEFGSVIESNDGDVTKLFIVLKDFINK